MAAAGGGGDRERVRALRPGHGIGDARGNPVAHLCRGLPGRIVVLRGHRPARARRRAGRALVAAHARVDRARRPCLLHVSVRAHRRRRERALREELLGLQGSLHLPGRAAVPLGAQVLHGDRHGAARSRRILALHPMHHALVRISPAAARARGLSRMEIYEILVILMFVGFVGLIFTGYPIAWVMGGIALWFALIGIAFNNAGVDTFLLKNFATFTIVIDRLWAIMSNWVLVALPNFVFMRSEEHTSEL